MSSADDVADQIEKLLDVALASLRGGDEEMALMALEEGMKRAESLPKAADPPQVICLPDLSKGGRS